MLKHLLLGCISASTGILLSLNSAQALDKSFKGTTNVFNVAQASDNSNLHNSTPIQELSVGVNEWLLKERIVMVSGAITDELADIVIPQLLYLDAQSPGKDIYLYINSPGGDITSGMAIYDVMRSLKSDVVTISVGQSSSMGSILLAGGTKGKRLALPNSRIMIHQPLGGAGGQATEVEIEVKELLYQKKQLNDLLARTTGQALKRIEGDTERNFYMSAQEAKSYGIIDRVVNQLPSLSRSRSR